MVRGKSEIEEHEIGALRLGFGGHGGENLVEVAGADLEAVGEGREPRGRSGAGFGVRVDADVAGARRRREDRLGVSARAQRAVDGEGVGLSEHAEILEHFGEHHGLMQDDGRLAVGARLRRESFDGVGVARDFCQ